MIHIARDILVSKQSSDLHTNTASKLFTLPLTEINVLDLQAIFVTPGVHTITMKNITEGRTIIQTILKSLNYYHEIGCITFTHDIADKIYDIIDHISFQKEQRETLLLNLEDFFAIHPCFDFIWIEWCEKLQKYSSLDDIKKIFNMYHADERMPVVCIRYEET